MTDKFLPIINRFFSFEDYSFSYRLRELGARGNEAQTDNELTQDRHHDSTSVMILSILSLRINRWCGGAQNGDTVSDDVCGVQCAWLLLLLLLSLIDMVLHINPLVSVVCSFYVIYTVSQKKHPWHFVSGIFLPKIIKIW